MAENAIQDPSESSAEMQEILNELESEGNTIEGKPEVKAEEPKPEPKKEPAKEPEPVVEEKKPEPPATDPDKKEPENKAPQRASKFVPVDKYSDERHKRQDAEARASAAETRAKELEDKINGLGGKPGGEDLDDVKAAATELAQKHGVDEEFAKDFAEKIVGIASKRNVVPQEIAAQLADLKKAKEEAESARQEIVQEQGFNKEFEDLVKSFETDPARSSYLAERKDELKQLVFSEGNVNTSLRRIALEYLHDNPPPAPGRKSAEAPVKISRNADDVIDFAEMTEDQLKALDGENLDKYLDWLDKKQK